MDRRAFLKSAAAAAALSTPGVFASPASSQRAGSVDYPARPVHLIVGGAAGNTTDILARLIGQWLSERLGQPFVIDNRPGAGSNIGTEAVVRASPDGYTLLLIGAPQVINATLYQNLNFNLIRDIAPVASMTRVPNVMEVNPSFPAKTVPEFISYAKANPGKINFASPGVGTSIHVSGELFKMLTGIDMVHVPYRGTAPALADLIGGQVQVMFDNMPSSIEHIRAGELRALAVTTATRWEGLPDIPTIADFVPGFEASAIAGIGAPKNTPVDVVDKLNREINAGFADPMMRSRLVALGATVLETSPAGFGAILADEVQKWAKVIKFAGARPD
jgi:tripartite-type tricarboxylate transporter receptor subunit TctC